MVKLQDFAVQQGVTDRQIQRLLKKYEGELEGLYERKGPNGTWLTDEACEILRSKMKQAPAAVFEPDPRVGQLQKELDEVKAAARDLWEQSKQKDKSMALLIEQNDALRLQAASVARLEADNEVARQKATEAEKTAQEAQQALSAAHSAFEIDLSKKDAEIKKKNEQIQAWEKYYADVAARKKRPLWKKGPKPVPPMTYQED